MTDDKVLSAKEPSTDGIPRWLVVEITKIGAGVKNNSGSLTLMKTDMGAIKDGQVQLAIALAGTDQKVENHVQQHRDRSVTTNPALPVVSNNLTYKWLANWQVKVGLTLGGGVVALAGKLIYDALTK